MSYINHDEHGHMISLIETCHGLSHFVFQETNCLARGHVTDGAKVGP